MGKCRKNPTYATYNAVRAIDNYRRLNDRAWSDSEKHALRICLHLARPTKKYTRDWALRTLGKALTTYYLGTGAAEALLHKDWRILGELLPYVVSKAPQQQKVEVESHHTEEHTVTVTWDKNDPESIKRAYEALFGTPAGLRVIEGGKRT